MHVRKFLPADLEQVFFLASDNLQERYSPNFIIDLFSYWPEGFLVLENNGRIESFIAGVPINRHHRRILMLVTHKDSRRKGYATILLREFIRLCALEGVRLITLEVRTSNVGAINLYRKMGFEVVKKIENYYRNGEPAYLMQLLL